MQLIRTLIWVAIAVLLALFAAANWTPVSVTVWPEWVLDTWLPVVVFAAFLLGLIPTWLLHRASRWRLTRQVGELDRQIADLKARPVVVAPGPTTAPVAGATTTSPVETPLP